MTNFGSNDPVRIYGALSTLAVTFKKIRFKKEQRFALVELTFPLLGELLVALVGQNTPRSFEMMKDICKIFFLGTELSLPPFVKQVEVMTSWVQQMCSLLLLAIPADQVTAT
jgi:hypothetical protein